MSPRSSGTFPGPCLGQALRSRLLTIRWLCRVVGITLNDVIRYAKKAFKVRLTRLLWPSLGGLPPIQQPTITPLIPPIQSITTPLAIPILPAITLNPTLNPIPVTLITLRQFWKKYQAKQNQQQQQGGQQYNNNNQQQYYGQNQQQQQQSPYPASHQGQQQGGAWAGQQQQQQHKPSAGGYGAHDGPATVS